MHRILIWRKQIPGSDMDIFHRTDYRRIYENIHSRYGYTAGINFGNKVWFQAICSVIDRPENELVFGTDETPEEINDHYDMIVYPMANFFGEQYCTNKNGLAALFRQIHIPVYIIACGAQADSYEQLDDLVRKIGDPAKQFIDSIYQTGGEFALRGYFTKAFFERLGYSGAVVTGCPSLFQLGPDLTIEKKHELSERPILNGRINSFESILRQLPESVFMDQDQFMDEIYNERFFAKRSIKKDILFARRHSVFQAQLLGEGRIRLLPDMNDWYTFLKEGGFDYSFGTKIHGSIMPLLAGIPATVVGIDSRTREMAEFFDIPYLPFEKGRQYSAEDLQAAFASADYSAFNNRFPQRFYAFERFLTDRGIVDKANTDNHFFSQDGSFVREEYQPNRERFQQYAKRLRLEKPLLELGSWLLTKRAK